MAASVVHLHVHTEYSLVDSTIRLPEKIDAKHVDPDGGKIPNLVSEAVRHGLPALAVTDEANLFAAIRFYRACELAGIKPIIGADAWFADPRGERHRATLLCLDRTGYRHLCELLTRAYRERDAHGHVTIDRTWFEAANAGLAVLLGPHSDVGLHAAAGRDDAALAALSAWQRTLGDRCHLELLRTGRPADEAWLPAALDLAASRDVAAVASNDVRFLRREDFEAHEARVAIHEGWVLNDPKRPRRYSESQYLKSPAEMRELFADLPEALDNTLELATRCNLELTLGKAFLPAFPVPEPAVSEPEWLRRRADEGLARRLATRGLAPGHDQAAYQARLALELDVIERMGFPGYFLIVADFIEYARRQGIPVGPGRGSGAGSLVAYAIGITDLDPLRFDLLFERFLNPERVSLPDFDIDFCMDRRDEVIDYVARRYGHDRVSQIITFGTMAAKAVLRDTGRVLGMSYGHVDRIAKMIPARPLDISLDDALGESTKSREEPQRVSPELREAYAADDEVRQLVDLARKLEGLVRNAGKHAGGVVIAPSPLTDFAPLYSEARDAGLVTHFDKDDLESVGLVKFDFLGLRTLTIIDWAERAINARRAREGLEPIDVAKLPLDDRGAFDLLQHGSTTAVFQLESRGMKELVRKLRPDRFDDIVALVALYRPGPLNSGMDKDYIARKHGEAAVQYPHPSLEPILEPTYGVFIYQEQVMQIAQVLAGYSLGGADLLRRAMGKKDAATMARERSKFEDGAAARGVDRALASRIFDLIQEFAEYGFNKSHSAAYALVSYQTAWLKAHYPAEFMAAVLSADMDHTDKIVHALDDARAIGLVVEPPDVNTCGFMFEAVGPARIRYGLGAIKGVGRAAIEALVAARGLDGPFIDLTDLCCRVDPGKLNKRALEALILSGAADGLDPDRDRGRLFGGLADAMQAAEQRLRDRLAGQVSLFGDLLPAPRPAVRSPGSVASDWTRKQILEGERDTLGYYLSGHPLDAYRDWPAQLASAPIGELPSIFRPAPASRPNQRPEQAVVVVGLVADAKRYGDQRLVARLEDASGRLEVVAYNEAIATAAPLMARGAIVVVEGGLQADDGGAFRLVARRITPIDEAIERHARLLRIEVAPDPTLASRLRAALEPALRGATAVRIGWRGADASAEIEFDERLRVAVRPDLVERLEALPGVVAVRVVLTRPTPPEPERAAWRGPPRQAAGL
jgi:DNA polymerase-3 subunit alpha